MTMLFIYAWRDSIEREREMRLLNIFTSNFIRKRSAICGYIITFCDERHQPRSMLLIIISPRGQRCVRMLRLHRCLLRRRQCLLPHVTEFQPIPIEDVIVCEAFFVEQRPEKLPKIRIIRPFLES